MLPSQFHKMDSNLAVPFSGSELPNDASLEECGVETGATLRLILALRGGPINTRRVPVTAAAAQTTTTQPNSGGSSGSKNQG